MSRACPSLYSLPPRHHRVVYFVFPAHRALISRGTSPASFSPSRRLPFASLLLCFCRSLFSAATAPSFIVLCIPHMGICRASVTMAWPIQHCTRQPPATVSVCVAVSHRAISLLAVPLALISSLQWLAVVHSATGCCRVSDAAAVPGRASAPACLLAGGPPSLRLLSAARLVQGTRAACTAMAC